MKKVFILFALCFSSVLFAQVPQGISYQAVAFNGSGNPVVSGTVSVRLSILDNSASGTTLYTETHSKTTNAQGLFNLVIGQGTLVSGNFNTINWRVNTKFLKIEMDATGGSNYTLVGSTQLLSVPYALAADSLVTSPGEGITLVSPNGTPYQLSVNDSGQLSLPTSGATTTVPGTLYLYGTYNNFNASAAQLMSVDAYNGQTSIYCYKYFTAGTQLKFVSSQNANATVYGVNPDLTMALNGAAYTIPSTGFYFFRFYDFGDNQTPSLSNYNLMADSISPQLSVNTANGYNPTSYNSSNNTFSFTINGMTNADHFLFQYDNHRMQALGDNLNDGILDYNGVEIGFPGATSVPKNYRVDLTIGFGGNATYTITQI